MGMVQILLQQGLFFSKKKCTAGAVFGPESAGGWCAATFGRRSRGEDGCFFDERDCWMPPAMIGRCFQKTGG